MTRAEAICALPSIHRAKNLDRRKETTRARTHARADGFVGRAFDAGKSLVAARIQIDDRRGNDAGAVNAIAAASMLRRMAGRLRGWTANGERSCVKGLNKGALNFLLQAEYSTDEVDTDRVDRGFRVERVVRNLTDPTDRRFRMRHSNSAIKFSSLIG